jgi:hypothetical protein
MEDFQPRAAHPTTEIFYVPSCNCRGTCWSVYPKTIAGRCPNGKDTAPAQAPLNESYSLVPKRAGNLKHGGVKLKLGAIEEKLPSPNHVEKHQAAAHAD